MRKGFTLIELLIVVTIIAILAGAAIPYVQDYVEESRRARAKNDLDEIRAALALYEVRRGQDYPNTNIASLIGPFLSKSLVDPWGGQYYVRTASSTVHSLGGDGQALSGDDIIVDYRPRMALTKAYWFDSNLNGVADNLPTQPSCDSIHLYFSRPAMLAYVTTVVDPSAQFLINPGLTVVGNQRGAYASLTQMSFVATKTLSVTDEVGVGQDLFFEYDRIASYGWTGTLVVGSSAIEVRTEASGSCNIQDLSSPFAASAFKAPRLDTIKIIAF